MKRVLILWLFAFILVSAFGGCSSVPSDMPEAKKLLINSWDLLDYDLHLIANAETSGKGLWCNPCLARKAEELRDDYHFAFYASEWTDVRGTHIAFNDWSYSIKNTIVVHKSINSAKRAFAETAPYFPWTYGDWNIAHVGDELKAWQSNVYNVNKRGTFEVLVCFRKEVVLVSLWVRGYAQQPCLEEIERFVLELARIVEAKIP